MATRFHFSTRISDLGGAASDRELSLTTGNVSNPLVTSTIEGDGIPGPDVQVGDSGTPYHWISNPLNAVTLSNVPTVKLYGFESSMSANAAWVVTIDVLDEFGNLRFAFTNSFIGPTAELGTGNAAITFSNGSITSRTLNNRDRLRVKIWLSDLTGTAMNGGFTVTFNHGGTSNGGTNDSFIDFVETITEATGNQFTQSVSGTMGALTGALSRVLVFGKSLAGTMGTFSGSITKRDNKSLSGISGNLVGSIVKKTIKSFSGATGTLSATINGIKLVAKDLSGTMGSLTGSIVKRANKNLVGPITLSATIAKLTGKATLSGVISSSGVIGKSTLKAVSGASGDFLGAISKATQRGLSGATGILSATLGRLLIPIGGTTYTQEITGAISSITGAISSSVIYTIALNGLISISGILNTLANKFPQRHSLGGAKVVRKALQSGGRIIRRGKL